jgi:surfactin synthase thioesterase subunit
MDGINVFFLPFAGGSKYSYSTFTRDVPDIINVIPLDLPGRGSRYSETLVPDAELLAEDILEQIKDQLDKPYAIYGHSMGSLIGYILCRKLEEGGYNMPMHLFFTGCVAPSTIARERKRHLLPKQEFLNDLRMLGGSPDEILENEILMEFFEPIIRSDFQAIETFVYKERPPMDVPITIINGDLEYRVPPQVLGWQKETHRKMEFSRLPGTHFFIFGHEQELLEMIAAKLMRAPSEEPAFRHAG